MLDTLEAPTRLDLGTVDAAVDRAASALTKAQRPDGQDRKSVV